MANLDGFVYLMY